MYYFSRVLSRSHTRARAHTNHLTLSGTLHFQKLVSNLSFALLYIMTGANMIPGSNVLHPLKLPPNGAASSDEL